MITHDITSKKIIPFPHSPNFSFLVAFSEKATQVDVFEKTTKTLVDSVIKGFNATVFAYGATGAGKTHTMLGTDTQPGIMSLTMISLFEKLRAEDEVD